MGSDYPQNVNVYMANDNQVEISCLFYSVGEYNVTIHLGTEDKVLMRFLVHISCGPPEVTLNEKVVCVGQECDVEIVYVN